MKRMFFIGLLLLMGCYEHIPNSVIAQNIAEHYLDSIYRFDTVKEKIGVGYVSLKEYSIPSTQLRFQKDTDHYDMPKKIDWADFTKKVNEIIAKRQGGDKGVITVES